DALKKMPDKERRDYFKKNESQFLENLIEMRLQLQEANRLGIAASDDEVNRTMEGIRKKYSLSEQDFEASIKKEGFTLPEYKAKLREQIAVGRLVDMEVRSKLVASDADVNDWLSSHPDFSRENEGYHISQIYILPKGTQQEVEAKLKQVYDDLNAGIPFAVVAQRYSQDASARNGGDLGFIKKGDLSKEFLDVIGRMKDGEISQPFSSDAGVHIIRLNETRIFRNEAEFRELLKQKVVDDRFARAYKNWRRGLRERAYVEIMLQ
ncbi:MAG TPA: peptidylprolyl isomerase, partial [Dissulfurispiraceae bacterium]|nr:peptidylprolyl isomerase [Dissulfurispiraceae bacterium]